jgi:hypothetical protein
MSAESDALGVALAAAGRFVQDVETTLRQQPRPPTATLAAASSAASASTTQLQSLLNALEASTAVVAKQAQDAAYAALLANLTLLRDKIKAVAERSATISRQVGT